MVYLIVCSLVANIYKAKEKMGCEWWYLCFLNWAAIEVFRSMHAVRSAATPEEARNNMGQYGAALSVTTWGLIHCIYQSSVTFMQLGLKLDTRHQLRMLLLGAILPFVALQASWIQSAWSGLGAADLPVLYVGGCNCWCSETTSSQCQEGKISSHLVA